jgi:hypothetical protein
MRNAWLPVYLMAGLAMAAGTATAAAAPAARTAVDLGTLPGGTFSTTTAAADVIPRVYGDTDREYTRLGQL